MQRGQEERIKGQRASEAEAEEKDRQVEQLQKQLDAAKPAQRQYR